eukprot:TRINITY_DN9190_c0_g2_i1.p1 TRINITY_DN9190_c0_g2~~TRINITY_DN9190_c0_g2_i1.p1  ORF type:complete len:506 (+),score=95.09 TRINITY_DN9190_c0_g2_i1:278-1795(+)
MGESPISSVMEPSQLQRLWNILCRPLDVMTNLDMRTHPICLPVFIRQLLDLLRHAAILVDDVRLEGSAATCCFSEDEPDYNDLDIVFHLSDDSRSRLCDIRGVLIQHLRNIMPHLSCLDDHGVSQHTFSKMFITPTSSNPRADAWALFTLRARDASMPSIDLKFVQRIQRPYQFSINSLQVILPTDDQLYPDILAQLKRNPMAAVPLPVPADAVQPAPAVCAPIYLPVAWSRACLAALQTRTAHVTCAYGDTDEVIAHIRQRIISVKSDGDVMHIHGGGLLKYAALRAQGFAIASHLNEKRLEHFMVQAFMRQYTNCWPRLLDYISTHMADDCHTQYNFFVQLSTIVSPHLTDERVASDQLEQSLRMLASMAEQHIHMSRAFYFSDKAKLPIPATSAIVLDACNPVTIVATEQDSAAGSICSSPPSSVRGKCDDPGALQNYDSGAVSDASAHTDDELSESSPVLKACTLPFNALSKASKLGAPLDMPIVAQQLQEITNHPLAELR